MGRAQADKRQPYPYSIKSWTIDADELRNWIQPDRYDEFIEKHFGKLFRDNC